MNFDLLQLFPYNWTIPLFQRIYYFGNPNLFKKNSIKFAWFIDKQVNFLYWMSDIRFHLKFCLAHQLQKSQSFALLFFFFFFFLGPVCISSGSTAAFKAYCVYPKLLTAQIHYPCGSYKETKVPKWGCVCTTHSILLYRRIKTMKQSLQFQSKTIQHLIIFNQWQEAHLDQRP
jgi:hypothetical protein